MTGKCSGQVLEGLLNECENFSDILNENVGRYYKIPSEVAVPLASGLGVEE